MKKRKNKQKKKKKKKKSKNHVFDFGQFRLWPKSREFHERTPKREKKERNLWRERERSANFWAPHPSGPHPFGAAPPFGVAPPFGGPTFSGFGPHPSVFPSLSGFGPHPQGPHHDTHTLDPHGLAPRVASWCRNSFLFVKTASLPRVHARKFRVCVERWWGAPPTIPPTFSALTVHGQSGTLCTNTLSEDFDTFDPGAGGGPHPSAAGIIRCTKCCAWN